MHMLSHSIRRIHTIFLILTEGRFVTRRTHGHPECCCWQHVLGRDMELVICEICEGVRPQAHFVYRGGARCRRVPLTFVQWRASFGALDSRREELAYFTCCVRLCRTCSTDSGLWHRGRSALVHCPARQFISMGRRRNDRRPRWRLRWVHHQNQGSSTPSSPLMRGSTFSGVAQV